MTKRKKSDPVPRFLFWGLHTLGSCSLLFSLGGGTAQECLSLDSSLFYSRPCLRIFRALWTLFWPLSIFTWTWAGSFTLLGPQFPSGLRPPNPLGSPPLVEDPHCLLHWGIPCGGTQPQGQQRGDVQQLWRPGSWLLMLFPLKGPWQLHQKLLCWKQGSF